MASSAVARANGLLKDSKPGEALDVLEELLQTADSRELTAGSRSTILANKGLCLEQLGRVDDAVLALDAALVAVPDNADAADIRRQLVATRCISRAVAAAERHEFTDALALFEEAGTARHPRECALFVGPPCVVVRCSL